MTTQGTLFPAEAPRICWSERECLAVQRIDAYLRGGRMPAQTDWWIWSHIVDKFKSKRAKFRRRRNAIY